MHQQKWKLKVLNVRMLRFFAMNLMPNALICETINMLLLRRLSFVLEQGKGSDGFSLLICRLSLP
jgi:hypothetical protein